MDALPLHRRDYKRFNLEAQATVILDKTLEIPLILKDLSCRGAGIVSNYPLEVNTQSDIVIRVPFWFKKPIYRKVKVVWCNKVDKNLWEAGLDFGLDNSLHFT